MRCLFRFYWFFSGIYTGSGVMYNLANVLIPPDARIVTTFEPDLFDGISVIHVEGQRVTSEWKGGLYQPEAVQTLTRVPTAIKAIPYCFWANRKPGEMRVWIRES